ncbi:MAG: hypothetical protein HKN22_01895, partial [Bacteroidia bacterium]|nr:hypothetical protein [Bacteroidia bacterium]
MLEDISASTSGTIDTLVMFFLLAAAFSLGYILRYYIGLSMTQRQKEDLDSGVSAMTRKIERLENENKELRIKLQESEKELAKNFVQSKDDLKKIEGIGPVIENMLNQEGIFKWTQLKSENVDNLKKIIYKGGDNFKI